MPSQITNHLFEDPADKFGMDLVALNLQRGREFGVPGYTAYRSVKYTPVLHGTLFIHQVDINPTL